MPNDGPPTSSQARLMPTRKQTITRIAIVSTAPGLLELVTISTASTSWITNMTASPSRNTASRTVLHRTSPRRSRPSRTSDSSAAATNASPAADTDTAAQPILCPGTRANSDTASALVNAVSAAEARMRWICAPPSSRASRSEATEMATNSSPISAPATPAEATKKSWTLSGTTRRFCQARRRLAADGVEFGGRLGRQDQAGRRDVLAEVGQGRGAGDEDHRGRAPQQPGQRDLLRGRAEPGGQAVQRRRLEWGEAAQREVGGVGDALGCAPVDHRVVAPVRHVVEVLHGDDRRDGLRLGE